MNYNTHRGKEESQILDMGGFRFLLRLFLISQLNTTIDENKIDFPILCHPLFQSSKRIHL